MFAVFGKSKKKEFENSFNKLGVKIKDEEKSFAKDTGCYQISGDFSSEKIAMDFVELCKGKKILFDLFSSQFLSLKSINTAMKS